MYPAALPVTSEKKRGMKTTRANRKICFDGRSLLSGVALLAAFGLAAILSADTPAPCQPGTLDTSFNGTGIVTTDFGVGGEDAGFYTAINSDSKIVVAGISNTSTNYDFVVVRS